MKGKKVLITRASGDNKDFREALEKKGLDVYELPMIQFKPVKELTSFHNYLMKLESIDWVVFTSSKAVEFFFQMANDFGVKFYFYPNLKIATVGEKTKLTLEQLGYRTNFVPIKYTAEVLAENMDENLTGKHILIPRSNKASDEYIDVFKKRGAIPLPITIYENEAIHYSAIELKNVLHKHIDYLTFTSGSTYQSFHSNIMANSITLQDEKTICIGPSTAKIVEELEGKVDAIATIHTIEGMVEAIEKLEQYA